MHWIQDENQMSRTFHLTSGNIMTLKERPRHKSNTINGKDLNASDVKGMVTTGLNALLISRNNIKAIISPGLKKKKKKKKKKSIMERMSIMLQLLLEDVNLMRIPMVMILPMMSCLTPMKKCASRERETKEDYCQIGR
jgi:hypothetical protein